MAKKDPMAFLRFRSNALSGLTLKDVSMPKGMSKDDFENWVKKEYRRHHK